MTIPWYKSRWVLISGATLALLIVGLLLVPFLVPVDHFRPLVVRLAEDSTGRKVEVGPLRLRVLPTIHLQVMNLRVKNPHGFPNGDTLAVKSVDVGTTLGSLLARRMEVTTVSFNGVKLNLLERVGGKTNYDFSGHVSAPAPSKAPRAKSAPAFSLDRIDAVAARNVEVTSGTYDPVRRRVVPSFAIAGLNVRVGGINLGAPNWMDSVHIAGDLRGVRFSHAALSKPLQFQKGSFNVNGAAAQASFTAVLDTLRAEGTLTVTDIKNPSPDFDIAIPELDVNRMRALATGGPGGAAPGGIAGPRRLLAHGTIKIGKLIVRPVEASAVTGRIAVYTDKAVVSSYSLAAFGGTMRGSGVADYASPRQPVHLNAQVRGVDLGAAIKATAPASQQGMTGKLDADARVATALAQDPIAALTATGTFALRDGIHPSLTKPIQIHRGTFNVKRGAAQASFAATVDTLRAQGAFKIANIKDPMLDFDVAVPELDVDRVRTLVANGKGSAAPGGAGGPRRLLATGTVKIERMIARPMEASAVTGRVNVYMDKVTVDSYNLGLYGGTARGAATVDYAAAGTPARVTARVRGVDFSRMMTALAPANKQKITGTLEADATLATAMGQDPQAALTGAGTFAVRDGMLPALDVKNTLVNMAKIVQVVPSGPTKFRYFGGDFRIDQQHVYSKTLKLDAEGLQAAAQGNSGFDRTLNYSGSGNVQGSLLGRAQSQLGTLSFVGNALGGTTQALSNYDARVPFSLRGTFDDPKFSPAGVPRISRGTAPGKQQTQQPAQPGQNPLQFLPLPLGP